jgi:hypothetical protein
MQYTILAVDISVKTGILVTVAALLWRSAERESALKVDPL